MKTVKVVASITEVILEYEQKKKKKKAKGGTDQESSLFFLSNAIPIRAHQSFYLIVKP